MGFFKKTDELSTLKAKRAKVKAQRETLEVAKGEVLGQILAAEDEDRDSQALRVRLAEAKNQLEVLDKQLEQLQQRLRQAADAEHTRQLEAAPTVGAGLMAEKDAALRRAMEALALSQFLFNQHLTADEWPCRIEFRQQMAFGEPDSLVNPAAKGFFNQKMEELYADEDEKEAQSFPQRWQSYRKLVLMGHQLHGRLSAVEELMRHDD